MEELSKLLAKNNGTKFVIEDTKKIQALEIKIKLNTLEYENQLIKLKNEIKKISDSYEEELVRKEKRVKAEMLVKYQSKVNIIPNLRNDIKRLTSQLLEK